MNIDITNSGVKLSCGLHDCPSKRHQLYDHSKIKCTRIVEWNCSNGHRLTQQCSAVNGSCQFCQEEDRKKELKRQRDLFLDAERERRQKAYMQRLSEAQDEVAHLRRIQREKREDEERANVLQETWNEAYRLTHPPPARPQSPSPQNHHSSDTGEQPTKDPEANASAQVVPIPEPSTQPTVPHEKTSAKPSAEKADWEYQKQHLCAQTDEIDKLMDMIGLEEIKGKFLTGEGMVGFPGVLR